MNIFKNLTLKYLSSKGLKITHSVPGGDNQKCKDIYKKFSGYTMIPPELYTANLELVKKYVQGVEGDIVECGVWKGGMIAGIAELLKDDRKYFLFDSFEGLPTVKEIDGISAKKWQENTNGTDYFDNCSASMKHAETAMQQTNCNFKLIKGWFDKTVPVFISSKKIALLRLDGDWYDSTLICLQYLYPKLSENGLLIIDDYYAWDGCSRAVHDYLSQIKSTSRIRTYNGVCFIVKKENG